jgi:hypothetical protein
MGDCKLLVERTSAVESILTYARKNIVRQFGCEFFWQMVLF